MTKAEKVRKLLAQGKLTNAQIAAKAGCSRPYVTAERQRMEGKRKPARKKPTTTDVGAVLDARAKRYGPFISHAAITQLLKGTMNNYLEAYGKTLMPDQKEALDMIFHKIGRILNGDPNYADSWTDIAGYATLVADRLEGKVR